jgi:type IV pilus assembly protein PilC
MAALTFAYTLRDATGTVIEGSSEAENEELLRKRLSEQGFEVLEIKQIKTVHKKVGGMGGVKKTELSIMCRQFSTMIDAGVSLVRCLNVLTEQVQSAKLRAILNDVRIEVEGGQMLAKSLEKYPNTFDRLFCGLVRAGEVGGTLEESLQRLSQFLEKDVELRRKVKSAMTYPTIVMVFALMVVVLLMTFILPKFMDMFKDLGIKDLPTPTAILKGASDFMLQKWYFAILIFGGLAVAIKIAAKTKQGRRLIDLFKLKAPVFGPLNHKVSLARFARTLATLLSSGVPILQALETVAGTVSNDVMSEAIMAARASIREGEQIAAPLAKSGMFPPMVVQMVAIGQESGALDPMLSKIADFYEDEVDAALASLTSAIEPVLIVFLGGVVGFIVISLFLPMIAVIQNLSGSSE